MWCCAHNMRFAGLRANVSRRLPGCGALLRGAACVVPLSFVVTGFGGIHAGGFWIT